MAKRATAHHSLLRLASVGLCNSGTGKPTAPLKKREAACPKGRPNQHRPLFFGGVGGNSYPRAALALDLDL